MTVIALTGGTGFVGSHVIETVLAAGHELRALTRRPQPAQMGVTWIAGALDDPTSLAELMRGADAVLHVAGLVDAPDRAAFAAGNIEGTRAMLTAAQTAGIARFVHVSSLSAREPTLSDYGWSKAGAEALVAASPLDWTIVRPPGVFGPRDTETLPLFQFAARGVTPMPAKGGRASWIYARDLAEFLVLTADPAMFPRTTVEPDDGTPGGWEHRAFGRAVGTAVGRRVLAFSLPAPLLRTASWIGQRVGGPLRKLTPDRVGYLLHRDWVSHARPPADVWRARTDTPAALAATAAWYRAAGLL
ncbi:MAG: NAD(P)H-binding protein [Sphingomonas sp.]|uniref:SDR family oxidoreductase n=1 Tax=Sphingomonas sp. TaxID=28214 RepID=UPI001ACB2310|nr:NAD(P)H-binding protein [Sphingomonas sp.]MBN8808382.1 NAD(P)H-binding protein [Sphingomonas sp.]